MSLEFYTTSDLSLPLEREITDFLDSQNTSHLFQFPPWNVSGARFALLRESGGIRWFGTFGMYSPLGAAFPWMQAVIANRGPVCDDRKLWHEVLAEFAEQLRRERIAYFDAVPDWVQTPCIEQNLFRNSGWEPLSGERSSLRLDLNRSEDEIFANFRKNSRYEVRRAERLGVTATPASREAEMEEFLMLYARLAARKGFAAEVPDDLRNAIRWVTRGDSRGALLLARFENVVYGGAVIGRSGKRCWYVWGASDKHEEFNVGHILQWKALLWAKSHGCVEYDFGGYTPGATSGPAWFKAGFGGTVVRFIPPHRKVIRPGPYRIFNFLSQMRKLSRGLPSVARA
jgi:peptidoglycan pentaglycine glycine transferase (the first glycine)